MFGNSCGIPNTAPSRAGTLPVLSNNCFVYPHPSPDRQNVRKLGFEAIGFIDNQQLNELRKAPGYQKLIFSLSIPDHQRNCKDITSSLIPKFTAKAA